MDETHRFIITVQRSFDQFEQILLIVDRGTHSAPNRSIEDDAAYGQAMFTIMAPAGSLGIEIRMPSRNPDDDETERTAVSLYLSPLFHQNDEVLDPCIQLVNGWDAIWYLTATKDYPDSEPFQEVCRVLEISPGDERELTWSQATRVITLLTIFFTNLSRNLASEA